jgi:hypothetical protein
MRAVFQVVKQIFLDGSDEGSDICPLLERWGAMAIKIVRIFPPIGIARLGNSESDFFVGPEVPGVISDPGAGYRDASNGIKRQGARFHLFAYDEADQLVREITGNDAQVKWNVHLANTKASAAWFGRKDDPKQLRNAQITDDRSQLNIDAGNQFVTGNNPDFPDLSQSINTGHAIDLVVNKTLFGKTVSIKLGTILTDNTGLLVVLGGHGKAESPTGRSLNGAPDPHHPSDFANHDEWYDDVADGSVTANITLNDGTVPEVKPAWVLVAPPKYAPVLQHPVTLYDTLLQAMVDKNLLPDPTAKPGYQPSYSKDILSILRRAFSMRWVYARGAANFPAMNFHRTFNQIPPAARKAVFTKLGHPPSTPGDPASTGGNMPRMWSDRYDKAFRNGTLTRIQYTNMSLWADGSFVDDSMNPSSTPLGITPEGLTLAALEPCIGAPFYPGIEASWKLRDEYPFSEPFRLDADLVQPGDVTKQMSLPWQSDFLDCAVEPAGSAGQLVWWPAQRPLDVLVNSDTYASWSRAKDGSTNELDADAMVEKWWTLGFLLEQADGTFREVSRIDS